MSVPCADMYVCTFRTVTIPRTSDADGFHLRTTGGCGNLYTRTMISQDKKVCVPRLRATTRRRMSDSCAWLVMLAIQMCNQ